MRERWVAFTLWFGQYRVEILRSTVASILVLSAAITERWVLASLIAIGTAIMFLAAKYGTKYQTLGSSMIAGKAERLKPDKNRVPDLENEHPIEKLKTESENQHR